jgi:hypothetical protein
MRYLVGHGFTTITLGELYAHLKYNNPLPKKPIVLTFDDGYLDNWVYAYPILKKYGLKATIFVVPEFVDPIAERRPNLEDSGRSAGAADELKWWGYLSWPEIKRMESDGVMDIQCHSMTHTWYFTSERIIDFHHPNDSYDWLAWNARPERKFSWVDECQEEFVGYGAPVYENGRSLGIRRYFEDSGLQEELVRFAKDKGGKPFFESSDWKKCLVEKANQYRAHNGDAGRLETDDEYHERLCTEIIEAKKIIEHNLEKTVEFLCWPGGAHTPEAYDLAIKSGFLATTKGIEKNCFGTDPAKLHRTATYLDSHQYSRTFLRLISLPLFVLEVQSYRGERISAFLLETAANLVRGLRSITNFQKRSAA